MKRVVFTIIWLVAGYISGFATKHIINTGATSFSPSLTEMQVGDTIVFNVGSGHTATEVSQSTWNSNGTTPNGIFNFGEGNNQQVIGLSVGTHYYVCQIHVGMGMKGQINVSALSGTKSQASAPVRLFPNPATNYIQWEYAGQDLTRVTLSGIDGKILQQWTSGNKTSAMSIASLPAGIYFVEGYAGDKKLWVEKFQKQ